MDIAVTKTTSAAAIFARSAPELIIVDEAAGVFGEWASDKKRSKEWGQLVRLLQVHRHYLMDVIFLYQDYSQLTHAQGDIKGLVERWYTTTNTSEMSGANTWNMVAKSKGFSLSRSANLDEKSGRFKGEIFDLYDSYSEGKGAGTKGKKTSVGLFKSRPIWLRWWFILLVLCLVALPVFMFRTAKSITSVVRNEQMTADFGTSSTAVLSPSQVSTMADRSAVPVVETLRDRQEARIVRSGVVLPAENVPFRGFDQNEVFFVDGSRFSLRSDFNVAGYQVLKMTACDVRFVRYPDKPEGAASFLRYTCERGF